MGEYDKVRGESRPSTFRKFATALATTDDQIDREVLISEYEMNYIIEGLADHNAQMGAIMRWQQDAKSEIERLEGMLIGLGVDPHVA